ncbi:hypothetical protein TNCV_4188691 [Trichonephila clavipes]|nr:hypothetical protein TNCV_4188691 [Trichonephila clavipes]
MRRIFPRYPRTNGSNMDPPDSNMDTEHTPTTDRERCETMSMLEEETQLMLDRINFLELTLARMRNGKVQKPKHDFDRINNEIEEHKNHLEQQKGKLLSLGSCPISNCQFHSNLNAVQIMKQNEEEALKLQLILANSISNLKNKVNTTNKTDEVKCKKTNRVEGFTSPTKVAKKQRILQNYSVGVDAPVNVHNKFNAIAGSSAMPDSVNAAVPVAPQNPPRSPSSI